MTTHIICQFQFAVTDTFLTLFFFLLPTLAVRDFSLPTSLIPDDLIISDNVLLKDSKYEFRESSAYKNSVEMHLDRLPTN